MKKCSNQLFPVLPNEADLKHHFLLAPEGFTRIIVNVFRIISVTPKILLKALNFEKSDKNSAKENSSDIFT